MPASCDRERLSPQADPSALATGSFSRQVLFYSRGWGEGGQGREREEPGKDECLQPCVPRLFPACLS